MHTIPIPNPGGGGHFDLTSGDEITIEFLADGLFKYDSAIAFTKETIPTGHFHTNNTIGPYTIDHEGETATVTLSHFDGTQTWDCVLTISGAPTTTA